MSCRWSIYCYGSRQMVCHLRRKGVAVGWRRVRWLMQVMGLEAVYRRGREAAREIDRYLTGSTRLP